ncbi:MAG: hypothetical protein IJ399_04625 [Bacilli bacterium]|nr:hypothetical protein [Bacilli bacterium]
MNKIVIVKNLEDLEKLRKYTNVDKLTIFLLNDIYFEEGYYHLPIELKNTDVIIYGLYNGIYNLKVNNKTINNAGLFGSVKNLYVKNLKMSNVKITANEINGVIAGRVNEDVVVDGVELDSLITSDAVSGGVVGTCNNIAVRNSRIFTTISGRGVLGGLAGIADKYEMKNTFLKVSFQPRYKNKNENILIDRYVGYLGERENERVMALTEEVNEYLEQHNYQRKMWM